MAYVPSFRAAMLAVAVFLFTYGPPLWAELTQEQVATAKAATGLLITAEGSGTAFCISESGLFITCDHALAGESSATMALVLDPAGKEEKRYPAKVLRRIKELDLAVLKVELDRKVPALSLADDTGLFETQQLCVLGYPFGKLLATDAKSYPSISVNLGRITSLRKAKGELEAIQLDAQLNPGNSGGPVLDDKGRVVGVVSTGILGSGVNYATPVSGLKSAIATPSVSVEMPKIAFAKRYEPAEFVMSVDWLQPPTVEPVVTFELTTNGKSRQVVATKGKDGKYRATLAPVGGKPTTAKQRLHVSLDFPGGRLVGEVVDRDITVGGQARALADLKSMERGAEGGAFTIDGKAAAAPAELSQLVVDLGGASITVDARGATRIEISQMTQEGLQLTSKVFIKGSDGIAVTVPTGAMNIDASLNAGSVAAKNVAPLSETREIKLPSAVADVVAGGDGRLLILYLKDVKKFAVFDVAELKIRGYVSVASDPVFFAAGSRFLLLFYPGANIIQRYSLETLEKEKTITNPLAEVSAMVMGSSAARYAFFICVEHSRASAAVNVFDVEKMAVVAKEGGNRFAQLDNRMWVRASADGRTVGCSRIGSSPSGFIVLTYKADGLTMTYEHESEGILVPNADGSLIFASYGGIYTPKFVPVFKMNGNWSGGTSLLPSYDPNYFIGVPYGDSRRSSKKEVSKTVALYTKGNNNPLITMPEPFPEMTPPGSDSRPPSTPDSITIDKRYHFYPQYGRILSIPPTDDKLVVRPVDIRKILEDKGIDYLYVTSSAPSAQAGKPYHYKMEAASKAGHVHFALQSGPEGLTIGADGAVNWVAPAGPADENVIVELKDASGQEVLHTFQIAVVQ